MNKKKILIIISSIIVIILGGSTVFIVNNNKKPITYNISFETNGGSFVTDQVVNEGEKVKRPVDPTKDGYIFQEWFYQGKTYDFDLEVKSDLVLIAKWIKKSEDIETFIVKFDSDGGSTIPNQIIEKGKKIEKPNDPMKDGYIFKGWTLNDEIYNFDKTVEENLELKAKWEKEKIISNNPVGNSNNSNNSTSSNDGSTNSGSNTSNQPTTQKYTVTFNSNGGSSVASQIVTSGNKATKPSNPIRSGYNFVSWTLNGSSYNFNSVVTGNITLIAKWTQKNYKITVTRADAYSPDSTIQVFEDGIPISVKVIKYTDGTILCYGSNTTVASVDIEGQTTFIVVLNDGMEVMATVQ